ncbi:hypothetical protein LEMLEM_LOCUS6328 [Lemmus lemmus]
MQPHSGFYVVSCLDKRRPEEESSFTCLPGDPLAWELTEASRMMLPESFVVVFQSRCVEHSALFYCRRLFSRRHMLTCMWRQLPERQRQVFSVTVPGYFPQNPPCSD